MSGSAPCFVNESTISKKVRQAVHCSFSILVFRDDIIAEFTQEVDRFLDFWFRASLFNDRSPFAFLPRIGFNTHLKACSGVNLYRCPFGPAPS